MIGDFDCCTARCTDCGWGVCDQGCYAAGLGVFL